MRRALEEVSGFYADHKDEIAERAREISGRRVAYAPAGRDELSERMVAAVVEGIAQAYDPEYGGFGDAPKFPQPEVLDFLLSEWRVTGEQRLYEMVARTMEGMSRGGMYDHVEGGFFRYSTTRDWSVPHFEKMAEDHAGLLRVLATLVFLERNEAFRTTLVSAAGYVRDVLRDPETGFFAGSQDADEEYFAMPLEERRKREAPYIDRTSYTNWTCGLAGAGCEIGRALDDDGIIGRACLTLDRVHERLIDGDGLAYHYILPGGTPQVRGLLTDQAAYLRALLDAYEASGEMRFRGRAIVLEAAIERTFEAEDGGFYDRAPMEAALGRLDVPDRPIGDNGLMAESLLRLAALTGESALPRPGRARAHALRQNLRRGRLVRRDLRPRASALPLARSDGQGRRHRGRGRELPGDGEAPSRRLDHRRYARSG